MNKADLVKFVSDETGATREESKKSVEAIVKVVKEALQNGEKVQLVGFGTWDVHERSARKGRNPKTGAEIDIPAKKVVKFKAGKSLLDEVNE